MEYPQFNLSEALQRVLEDEIPYMVICPKCDLEIMFDDYAGFNLDRLKEKILDLLEA